MKPAFKAAAIWILISQATVILIMASYGWEDNINVYAFHTFLLGVLGLIPGGICLLLRKRDAGFGFLIGCGIMLVIGYSACAMGPGLRLH
jgi:hypothetical protein